LAPQSQGLALVLDLSAADSVAQLLSGPASPAELVRVADIYEALSGDNDPPPNLVDACRAQPEEQTSSLGGVDEVSAAELVSVGDTKWPPAKFRWCANLHVSLHFVHIQHTNNVPAQG
jgi:hypothetical protein